MIESKSFQAIAYHVDEQAQNEIKNAVNSFLFQANHLVKDFSIEKIEKFLSMSQKSQLDLLKHEFILSSGIKDKYPELSKEALLNMVNMPFSTQRIHENHVKALKELKAIIEKRYNCFIGTQIFSLSNYELVDGKLVMKPDFALFVKNFGISFTQNEEQNQVIEHLKSIQKSFDFFKGRTSANFGVANGNLRTIFFESFFETNADAITTWKISKHLFKK
jgi:hypothetical protein